MSKDQDLNNLSAELNKKLLILRKVMEAYHKNQANIEKRKSRMLEQQKIVNKIYERIQNLPSYLKYTDEAAQIQELFNQIVVRLTRSLKAEDSVKLLFDNSISFSDEYLLSELERINAFVVMDESRIRFLDKLESKVRADLKRIDEMLSYLTDD